MEVGIPWFALHLVFSPYPTALVPFALSSASSTLEGEDLPQTLEG